MHGHPRLALSVRILLVVLVTAYGALLRLDAISEKFDPVQAPQWLHRLELWRVGPSRIRPADMRWEAYPRFVHKDGPPTQYRGDPYTYLQYAREMRSFYAAHRREPLFPFATKVSLWLLHDSDSAVSFASGAFSVLAIVLTFALGAEAFSYWVGLTAAALWAIEFDLITSGTEGWRDDTFVCTVLLTAWLLLLAVRQRTWRIAVALGTAAGAACLVRVTSLSFLVPSFGYLLLVGSGRWLARLRFFAIVAAVTIVVAGPFLFNCWRVYGDPFYSIDVLVHDYRNMEGKPGEVDPSARAFFAGHLRQRPATTIDTFALGLTQYPFENKWTGFTPWQRQLGRSLAAASLLGLFLWAGLPQGRLLLVVLGSSLLSFATTWRLSPDWRFTEHAYAFFLIAACSVPWFAVRAFDMRARLLEDRAAARTAVVAWATSAAAILVCGVILTRITPSLIFKETVQAGEPATILAGDRDSAFFQNDWPQLVTRGTPTRVAPGPRATIVLPLPVRATYDALVRVDPSTEPVRPGAPVSRIQLLLNGRLVAVCDPGSTPSRIGLCSGVFPADDVRVGPNRLTLVTEHPFGFRVWYVRITKRPA
jgi:hypothetical protein